MDGWLSRPQTRSVYAPWRAAEAARRQPTCPAELAAFLAASSPRRSCVLDCGCGSGQLSLLLAEHFEHVVAIDASTDEIADAIPHPLVTFRVARAEDSRLPVSSVDLLVARGAHRFNLSRFWKEAARVLRPAGVVALIGHGRPTLPAHPAMDAIIGDFYERTLGPYQPPEWRTVEESYTGIAFPGRAWPLPEMWMTASWSYFQLIRYVSNRSVVDAARKALGYTPVADLARRLGPLWEAGGSRAVSWRLFGRVGEIGARVASGG